MRVFWSKNVMDFRRNKSSPMGAPSNPSGSISPARYRSTMVAKLASAFAATILVNTLNSFAYSDACPNPNVSDLFTRRIRSLCASSLTSVARSVGSENDPASASNARRILDIKTSSSTSRRVVASVSAKRDMTDSISPWNVAASGTKANARDGGSPSSSGISSWSSTTSSRSKFGATGYLGSNTFSASSSRLSFSARSASSAASLAALFASSTRAFLLVVSARRLSLAILRHARVNERRARSYGSRLRYGGGSFSERNSSSEHCRVAAKTPFMESRRTSRRVSQTT